MLLEFSIRKENSISRILKLLHNTGIVSWDQTGMEGHIKQTPKRYKKPTWIGMCC